MLHTPIRRRRRRFSLHKCFFAEHKPNNDASHPASDIVWCSSISNGNTNKSHSKCKCELRIVTLEKKEHQTTNNNNNRCSSKKHHRIHLLKEKKAYGVTREKKEFSMYRHKCCWRNENLPTKMQQPTPIFLCCLIAFQVAAICFCSC